MHTVKKTNLQAIKDSVQSGSPFHSTLRPPILVNQFFAYPLTDNSLCMEGCVYVCVYAYMPTYLSTYKHTYCPHAL